jgi:hypothetical protein
MGVRLVLVSVLFLAAPALTQQSKIYPGSHYEMADVRPEPPRDLDLQAAHAQEVRKDIQELSSLSAALQTDLVQLQKGMRSKDLGQHLKRIEKLSKKVRQEVGQ